MFVHDAQQLSQLPWRVESTVVARTHRSGFASGVPSLHAFVPRRCWRGFSKARSGWCKMTIISENSSQVLATTRQNDNGTVDCVVITPDNKCVCLSSGKKVAIHNAQTGRKEYILSEASKVVTLCCNDTMRLIIYLSNGMRIEHDLSTNTALECRDLQEQHLLAAFEDKESRVIFIVCDSEELCVPIIKKVTMNVGREITKQLVGNESFKMPKIHSLKQLTLSGQFMAACEDLFVRTYLFESGITRAYKFTGKEEFNGVRSCFISVRAFHSVSLIAVLSFGRVLVWDNVIRQLRTPTQCVHWHRLAPSVILTPQGAIISGGVEGVIVKYAAHGSRTGSTADSFLSRLGAAISHLEISEDGSLLVAALLDNTVVMVLLSTMAVYSRLETLQRPIGTRRFALTVDPLMPHLVVHNGRPGCIQWINPCTMLTTAMLDVVSQNLPEVIQPQPPILAPHIDVSAVALSETTIMTAEQRVGDEIEMHVVKFWRRNTADLSSLEFSIPYESGIRFARSSDTSNYTFASIDTANKVVIWERYVDEEYSRWAPTQCIGWKGLRITAATQICDGGLATIHEWNGKCSRRSTAHLSAIRNV
uniref:Ovule protein n=1 Tax=Parascaris univalens TaxID=6257 RepID=A0A914ZUW1_PARUN